MDHIDSGIVEIGKEIRAVVSLNEKSHGKERIIFSLTKKQGIFLRVFLQTGNFKLALETSGAKETTALAWFRQKNFRLFIKERIAYAANRAGISFDWFLSRLKDIAEGEKKASFQQLRAYEILGKSCGFSKERISVEHVNQPIQFLQSEGAPELEAPPGPAEGDLLGGEVRLSFGRTQVGKDEPHALPAVEAVRETALDSVVRGTDEKSGDRYSVATPS